MSKLSSSSFSEMRARELSLRSEFGWAIVQLDLHANGPRLRIHAPRSGRTVLLDPLEVESLTQWGHDDLTALVLGGAYTELSDSAGAIEDGGDGKP